MQHERRCIGRHDEPHPRRRRHGLPGGLGTTALQSPTGCTDIYANWNIDLDGDYAADDPWDFGSPRQYPSLKWRGFDTAQQFAVAEVPDEPEEGSRVPTQVRTETRGQGQLVLALFA